jgi:predicted RNA-binding Zn-ribbon protein involved in translation (DUF1610 family)
MEFVQLESFYNYIDAHLLKTHLESEGVECWLQDENTGTISPGYANVFGGIKLLVSAKDYSRARKILREAKSRFPCARCNSLNTELVTSLKKPRNWIGVLAAVLFGNHGRGISKTYHCFDCGHEFHHPE